MARSTIRPRSPTAGRSRIESAPGSIRAPRSKQTCTSRSNGEAEIVFFLGEAASKADALALITKYRSIDLDSVLAEVTRRWDDVLGTVQVKTPDRSMDLVLNRWLLYQTLACRVWARSAFYQAGGAYGFRDQLQDVMALMVAQPAIAREHLIRASGRQFEAGDVQHWWLPPSGQGVRTRISDNRIWLPFAVAHYVEVTGDLAVLDETFAFLDGPALHDDQNESFFQPMVSEQRATVFEHCARALDVSLAVGVHGLPLMGTGDWNDGMNRVGDKGKGESIWLGWFLYTTLLKFAEIAQRRGEEDARFVVAQSRSRPSRVARTFRMGRQLVSARIFRRRHAARFSGKHRVPDRFDRAVVGGNFRRRRSRSCSSRDGGG